MEQAIKNNDIFYVYNHLEDATTELLNLAIHLDHTTIALAILEKVEPNFNSYEIVKNATVLNQIYFKSSEKLKERILFDFPSKNELRIFAMNYENKNLVLRKAIEQNDYDAVKICLNYYSPSIEDMLFGLDYSIDVMLLLLASYNGPVIKSFKIVENPFMLKVLDSSKIFDFSDIDLCEHINHPSVDQIVLLDSVNVSPKFRNMVISDNRDDILQNMSIDSDTLDEIAAYKSPICLSVALNKYIPEEKYFKHLVQENKYDLVKVYIEKIHPKITDKIFKKAALTGNIRLFSLIKDIYGEDIPKNVVEAACFSGNDKLIELIRGSLFSSKALLYAVLSGNARSVEIILSSTELCVKDYPSVEVACQMGNIEIIRLLSEKLRIPQDFMKLACELGYTEIVREFISQGYSPGMAEISAVVRSGNKELLDIVVRNTDRISLSDPELKNIIEKKEYPIYI